MKIQNQETPQYNSQTSYCSLQNKIKSAKGEAIKHTPGFNKGIRWKEYKFLQKEPHM